MNSEPSTFCHDGLCEVAGGLGVMLWAIRLGSQLIVNRRRGAVLDVHEVPGGRRFVAGVCFLCWAGWAICAYLVLAVTSIVAAPRDGHKLDIPALILPHVSILAFVALAWQIVVYQLRSGRLAAWLQTGGLVCLLVALETLSAKLLMDGGGSELFAGRRFSVVIASAVVCMAFGYWPLGVEAVQHQGRGVTISMGSCLYGILACLGSLLSTVYRPSPSPLAIAIYATALTFETGFLVSHVIWMLRTRHERRVAAALGITFDELAAERVKAGDEPPFRFAASRKMNANGNPGGRRNDDDVDSDDDDDSRCICVNGPRRPAYTATWPRAWTEPRTEEQVWWVELETRGVKAPEKARVREME